VVPPFTAFEGSNSMAMDRLLVCEPCSHTSENSVQCAEIPYEGLSGLLIVIVCHAHLHRFPQHAACCCADPFASQADGIPLRRCSLDRLVALR